MIEAISAYIAANPGQGFFLLQRTFRREGSTWGKSRLWRVYCELRLNLPRRGKRPLPERVRDRLVVPAAPNQTWSADSMAVALWSGRRFRTFNAIDDFNRESLRIEIDTYLASLRVIRALDELVEIRGTPQRLRLDNGPEPISQLLHQRANTHRAELVRIRPGKPTQNAYIERFNRTLRTEALGRYVFTILSEVRRMTADRRHRRNHHRLHRSLGRLPPVAYAQAQSPTSSTSDCLQ